MGERDPGAEIRRFGRYLRRVREDRKLSLDAVEEMTTGYPDRVTKSHLSRIENGVALPSFGKMFALSQVYGVPISAMAERFEMDFLRQMTPVEAPPATLQEVLAELERLKMSGDYAGGLALLASFAERVGAVADEDRQALRLYEVDFLAHLERYELAKVVCERLLGSAALSPQQRMQALMSFIICCYRLKRYTIAEMAIQQVDREFPAEARSPKLGATFTATRAVVQTALGRLEEAIEMHRTAIGLYGKIPDAFEACRARVNLAQTMLLAGQVERAEPHLRTALKRAEESGYDRLKGLALSHLAVLHFLRDDPDAAETYALRSNVIARSREYLSLIFRNCFYLRRIAQRRGDTASASQNERTLNAYLNRVDPDLPEAAEYRNELAGGRR